MSARKTGAGAHPIESTLAPLFAVANALSNPKATIQPSGVAYMLGISETEARELIDEVALSAEGGEQAGGAVLPLIETDGGELFLAPSATPPAALRLTTAQAQAVDEVLDALGLDERAFDGIRSALERALYPVDAARKAPRGDVAPTSADQNLPGQLASCLDAIAHHRGLAFSYEGQRTSSERRVEPLTLGFHAGEYVLQALDLDALEGFGDKAPGVCSDVSVGHAPSPTIEQLLACRRSFRVRRMGNLESFALTVHHDELKALPWDAGNRWARLYFTDRRLFEDHEDWMWARPVPRAELNTPERRRIGRGGLAVDVLLFDGSPYLARLIVSCGGACTSDDPEVKAQVQRLLANLP